MRSTVGTYGSNLNLDQQFILQNAVLVTESVRAARPAPVPKIRLIKLLIGTAAGWGLFDGPGTDGKVSMSILDAGGAELYSTLLDNKSHFSAGKWDSFELISPTPFVAAPSARPSEFGHRPPRYSPDTWTMDGVQMEAYVGEAKGKPTLSAVRSDLNYKFTDSNLTYDVPIKHDP